VRDLQIFKSLLESDYDDQVGKGDYVYIRSSKEMEALFGLLPGKGMLMALDCEWGYVGVSTTKRPVLRSIQISWEENKAACFVFHEAGGVPAQSGPEMTRMLELLRQFIVEREIKLTGHNLRADALLLEEYSIPVMKHTVFDSMLADHMLNENSEHGLEYCTLRYTSMGRYDSALNRWRAANGLGLKEVKRVAYLHIPGEILYPYGAADADASLRIAKVLSRRIDAVPSLRNCYYKVVLPTSQAIYEIERNGIQVDQERMVNLVELYDGKKKELLQAVQDKLKIPTFNPGSYKQMSELLFGSKASGGFGIRPVKTTGKPSRMWDDIPPDELGEYAPSTDQETLEYIAHENPIVTDLRDYKMIEQVQKSFLRLPSEVDGQSGEAMFADGLLGSINPDGRVRTHLSQMSETGRHRSSNPNLQNLPKKQDKETSRIMGSLPTIRSCFTASPGHVLIEADYKSAEVFTLAYLSNCEKLIRDARGDLHARGAVSRFGAPKWAGYDEGKAPPPEWLEEFKAVRVASKTVTFGIPYQRGAAAIAREITKSTKGKIYCDKDTAQKYVDNFYEDYPEVENFVEMSKQSVIEPGYLFNPFGRHRRATPSTDTSHIAAQQREFVNFPIQSTVADCLNEALINFFHYRGQFPGRAEYRLLLAIHDAVLLECRPEYVRIMVEEVIPVCMTRACVVPSWRPTPNYKPTSTFTLDTDIEVCLRWQEKASADELRSVGLEEELVDRFKKKEKKA
jgi:DNA polymerase-1